MKSKTKKIFFSVLTIVAMLVLVIGGICVSQDIKMTQSQGTVAQPTDPTPGDKDNPSKEDPDLPPKQDEEEDPKPVEPVEIKDFRFDGEKVTSCSARGVVTIPSSYSIVDGKFVEGDDYIVTTLGSRVFYHFSSWDGIDNITEIILPETITKIETQAVHGIEKLTKINTEHVQTIERHGITDNIALTHLDLSSAIDIGDNAFNGCSGLQSVVLSDELTSLPESVFQRCSALENIDLKNVKSLGDNCFSETGLTSIDISNIDNFGDSIFASCPLNEVKHNLTIIPKGLFQNSHIKTFDFSSIIEIGDLAFAYCTELKDISLKGVNKIGASAFLNCSSLGRISLDDVREIGTTAFAGCKYLIFDTLEVEVINASVYSGSAIFDSDALTEVYIGKNKTEPYDITGSAWIFFCKNLKKVHINALANFEDMRAFQYCGLTTVEFFNNSETQDFSYHKELPRELFLDACTQEINNNEDDLHIIFSDYNFFKWFVQKTGGFSGFNLGYTNTASYDIYLTEEGYKTFETEKNDYPFNDVFNTEIVHPLSELESA